MAAKDADIATEYVRRELFLVDDLTAKFEIFTEPAWSAVSPAEVFMVELSASGGGAVGGPTYRMRGNDGTLGYPVYWESVVVDSAGVDYAGPGPLTDIVVAEVIAA